MNEACGCRRPDCTATTPHTWHPPRLGVNEYGTPTTEFCCQHCGHSISVCPAIPLDELAERWGLACLGDTCPSYDISRDAGIFFEPALTAGWIKRVPTESEQR